MKPILLFGMPRSGTTWLGKVFDSHPATLYRHEPDSGGALEGVLPMFPDPVRVDDYRAGVRAFVEGLRRNRSLRVAGKLPLFRKSYEPALAFQARQLLVPAAKALARWFPVSSVPEFIDSERDGSIRLVWKSIESLGRLGAIARILPEARAIHIIRHPCGYVSSVLSGESAGLMPGAVAASEDYGILEILLGTEGAQRRNLTLDFFRGLQPVERLAWRWLLYNERAIDDLEGLENGFTAIYEDLCRDPVGGYRALFDFADLNWDAQTGAFVDASTHSEKSAYFSVFKNPERAASGWKQKLSPIDQERVLSVVSGSRPGAIFGA
jgi:hypothetical protein